MATQLVPHDDAQAHAALLDVVDKTFKSIQRERDGSETLPALPSKTLRAQLEERKLQLNTMLRPISMSVAAQNQAGAAILALLAGYARFAGEVPAAMNAAYYEHLKDQPLFAIQQACDDFKHGRVFDVDAEGRHIPVSVDHPPSAYRLLVQVKKRAVDRQEEAFKIRKVLSITRTVMPTISEEERARVAEKITALAAALKGQQRVVQEAEKSTINREAQEARDRATKIIQEAKGRPRDAAIGG